MSELLAAVRLRRTRPRTAVLGLILEQARPLSHGEVVGMLSGARARARFDQATVYRVLMDLERAGVLNRLDPGDRVWRFELREGGGHTTVGPHPHFVCEVCGLTLCLPDAAVEVRPTEGQAWLEPSSVTVRIRGACDRCRRAPPRGRRS